MGRGYFHKIIGTFIMSGLRAQFPKHDCFKSSVELGVDYYTGPAQPVEKLREFLGNFEGGKVDLQLNNENGIARVILNNPGRRNAVTGRMMVELEDALQKLENWKEGKGVIICGAEGNFCSGGDLEFARKTGTAEDAFKLGIYMQHVLNKLETLPMISVAFINGTGAIGGGSEIAVSCDFRLMTPHENTGLGFVHAKMGIVPAWGGALRLVRLVGKQTALDLLTTARIIKHDEGMKLGLVNNVVLCIGDAEKWLVQRTNADKSVVSAMKCLVLNSVNNTENPQEVESRFFAPLWGGPANKEALDRNIKHRTSIVQNGNL